MMEKEFLLQTSPGSFLKSLALTHEVWPNHWDYREVARPGTFYPFNEIGKGEWVSAEV